VRSILIIISTKFSRNKAFCWRNEFCQLTKLSEINLLLTKQNHTTLAIDFLQKYLHTNTKTQAFSEVIGFLLGTKVRTFTDFVGSRRCQVVGCKVLKGPIQGRRFARRRLFFLTGTLASPVPSLARSFRFGLLAKEYKSYSSNESDVR